MTRLLMSTALVPGDLPEKLERISSAGFDGVELYESDLTGFAGTAKDVGNYAKSLGLTIDIFHPFHDFEGLIGRDRELSFRRLDQKLSLMVSLGAKTLLVGSTTRKDSSSDRSRIVGDFSELSERVGLSGCRAALMALPWAAHITRELDALEIVDAVDSCYFGLGISSFFSLADGSHVARLRDIRGGSIFHVQLSDAPLLDSNITRLKGHFGMFPGQGGLNLVSFVRMLSRSGYDGPWSIPRVRATVTDSRETYARDGYRSLVSLLDEVSAIEPSVSRPLLDLPSKELATGFEFIEFAVDDEAREELTRVLSSMSFRMERRHCSKSVELWRQGAVNLVVNSEKRGFSAGSFAEHGPCVCDMGLRVRNANNTVKRAMMLGAPSFSQPVGSGELDIPAIKCVGGSVLHFIDEKSDLHRVWDIEFDRIFDNRSSQPVGLRRVDHIAQTMRYQEMQSWLTYYLSTFEMEKADVVDVSDPSGIILSQALLSPEGQVRINLNGALEDHTFVGSFLTHSLGAGVQHIAFSSDDIFETSELLSISGFDRLEISDNYYDDLGVRFDLEAAKLERLRSGNILYDRDGTSEYYQIYSVPFWGGFFFEIIERCGGYDGYGARNAPVRLAAQMQYRKSD